MGFTALPDTLLGGNWEFSPTSFTKSQGREINWVIYSLPEMFNHCVINVYERRKCIWLEVEMKNNKVDYKLLANSYTLSSFQMKKQEAASERTSSCAKHFY